MLGLQELESQVVRSCMLWVWKLNSGALQEQYVFLTDEPSLSSLQIV